MVFEPILFSLTGTQIRIAEIDPEVFLVAVVVLVIAFTVSSLSFDSKEELMNLFKQ